MINTKQTDESLMQRYAKGHVASFELLYGRHKDALYRYFVRQVSDIDLAQDVYQEYWGRIIKSAGSYTPESKWTTWAYRIAHNLVVDHYRSFKPVDADVDVGTEIASKSLPPDKLHHQALIVDTTQALHAKTAFRTARSFFAKPRNRFNDENDFRCC